MKNKTEKVIANNIIFDREKMFDFQKKYFDAIENKKEIFSFEGMKVYAPYAKYLIEFLKSKLGA